MALRIRRGLLHEERSRDLEFLQTPRRRMRPVIEQVVRADPECFYIVDDVRLSSGRKVRYQPPGGWRALFRRK